MGEFIYIEILTLFFGIDVFFGVFVTDVCLRYKCID